MASPFQVFRKNQRVLMALLVGFSMIAFIAADTITPQNFPIFLGALLGALALWLLSGKGGTEGWLIAIVGGVLGAIVGVYGPSLFRDNTVVDTDKGSLTAEQIDEIAKRQSLANQFLGMAYNSVIEKAPKDQPAPIPQPQPFGFDPSSPRDNAVLTFLFEKEAEDLGIRIDESDVVRFIEDITGGQMSSAELRQIRGDLQVGSGELVDILREQIKARDAFLLLVPRTGPTPQQLWNDFKKLSNQAEVTAVTIPAEAFVSQVDDPSDERLSQFFDLYRQVPPGPAGQPGFLVPPQVQVAYVEIALDDLKKTVKPPSDAEVRAFYEKNRAQFEFGNGRPGARGTSSGTPGRKAPVEAPRAPNPANATEAKPSSNNPPAEPAKSDDDAAKPEASTSTPSAPAETPSAPAETPSAPAETPSAPAETPPANEDSKPESTPEKKDEQASLNAGRLEYVAFQQDDAKPAAEPAANAKPPAENNPADAAPNADAANADAPPASSGLPTEPPAFPAPGPGADTSAEPSQSTLDQIRKDLYAQRIRDAADAKLEKARDEIDRIVQNAMDAVPLIEDRGDPRQVKTYEERRRKAIQSIVAEMKDYAKKNGLKFQTTPYMSAADFYDSEDYPIGQAVRWEKNAPLFGRDTTPIVESFFTQSSGRSSISDQPLIPIPAQSLLSESRFVALKIAEAPSRPAELSEEGMKAKVVKAWKLIEARKLAKERAEQLAAEAKKSGGLAEIAKQATVTGKPGGKELKPITVGPFSWLHRSTAPRGDFAPPDIVPTNLQELPAAGEQFMETVFRDLKVGEIGVAPAQDQSAYYVVRVDHESLEANLPQIHEQFLREDFFHSPLDALVGQPMNPFRRRMMMEMMEARAEWIKKFRERHGVAAQLATVESEPSG